MADVIVDIPIAAPPVKPAAAFRNLLHNPGVIFGVVVTESVFTIPGLGRLTVDAVLARDYPTIQAVILLFSFVYVMINLAVDMIYTLLDPRIRY